MARDPYRQTAEFHIRFAFPNRLNAVGPAETFRVA